MRTRITHFEVHRAKIAFKHLREVILALWTSKWVIRVRIRKVSAYGELKFRILVEKLPGPQFSVRLWEVSVSGGSTAF